jgi:hypothetical protein
MRSDQSKETGNPRGDEDCMSIESIVQDYIDHHRARAEREFAFFSRCGSFRRVIEFAALSMLPSRKRHPHQRRIAQTALAEAECSLQAVSDELQSSGSFEELHAIVEREIGGIRGIGPLTVYDVAHRLGANLNMIPEKVYLHAGTSAGAKSLGLDHRKLVLDPEELPRPFKYLRPYEVEDCLCIYKDELERCGAAWSLPTACIS